MVNEAAIKLTCPSCEQSIKLASRFCPKCHFDIAKGIVEIERMLVGNSQQHTHPLTPEAFTPYLGQYLVEQHYITQPQLNSALAQQQELTQQGKPIQIGQLLIKLGFITDEQLNQVVGQQMVEAYIALQNENELLRQQMQRRSQQLQVAFAQLAELSQLKSEFVSTVSQELTTPLLHLTSYLELLTEGHLGPLTSEQSQALNASQRTTHQLQGLIEDLLEFSAISRGNYDVDLTEISLDIPLLTAVSKSLTKAKARQIALSTYFTNNIPNVQADGKKITWVLEQLLDNAIKFTQPGGEVVICAELQADNVQLSIRDTGIGIPQQYLETIFEPFRQLPLQAHQRMPGTGLGLALAKSIVEAHGSNLHVQSQQQQGTFVSFTLPTTATNV